MANIPRIRLAGFWTQNSVVDPEEFEDLDEIRPWLANFTTGSSHTPSGFVTVGGSGFQLTGTGHEVATSARLTVQSTGEIRVASGGLIRLDGTSADIDMKVTAGTPLIDVGNGCAVRILSGGSLDVFGTATIKNTSGPGSVVWQDNTVATFNDGAVATFQNGAEAVIADGATLTVAGQQTVTTDGNITLAGAGFILGGSGSTVTLQGANNLSSLTLVGASTWPELATSRTIVRKANKCIPLTYSNGGGLGPLDADVWESKSPASDAPCWRYRKFDASGKFSLLEVIGLPIGAVITSATIVAVGSEPASVASTLPYYQIVSWVTGLAAYTNHSLSTVDAASSSAAFATTAAETTVAATGTTASRTVDETRRYGILVTHPYEATNDQGMIVYNAYITATVGAIKL